MSIQITQQTYLESPEVPKAQKAVRGKRNPSREDKPKRKEWTRRDLNPVLAAFVNRTHRLLSYTVSIQNAFPVETMVCPEEGSSVTRYTTRPETMPQISSCIPGYAGSSWPVPYQMVVDSLVIMQSKGKHMPQPFQLAS